MSDFQEVRDVKLNWANGATKVTQTVWYLCEMAYSGVPLRWPPMSGHDCAPYSVPLVISSCFTTKP